VTIQFVPHGPFPIGGALKRSLCLQPFSRYWALSILGVIREFDLSGLHGARLWNSLPHDIVASDTLSHFRRGLKTFLFRQSLISFYSVLVLNFVVLAVFT